jgi:hypothetical protein
MSQVNKTRQDYGRSNGRGDLLVFKWFDYAAVAISGIAAASHNLPVVAEQE